MNNRDTLTKKLEALIDSSSEKTLKETGGIKFVSVEDQKVNLIIALNKVDEKTKTTMTREIAKLVKLELGYSGVKIEFQPLKLEKSILAADRKIRYIGIASGKGGVGKSTIAANLALSLTRLGKKVGVIDADIYGSSLPTIFDMDIHLPKVNEEEKIIPFNVRGVELISTEFFMKSDQPLMWRGPMLGKMLNHFFYDVAWSDDLEYILIDLPPGTGDVAIDIQKLIPECKMLIVTTPHTSASHVAVKAGFAAVELKHTLLGVVENMSYYNHKGETLYLFGQGGGSLVAKKLKTPLLAQLPIGVPESGHHSLFDVHEPLGVDYLGLANKLLKLI